MSLAIEVRDLAARFQEALATLSSGAEVIVLEAGAAPKAKLTPLPPPGPRKAGMHLGMAEIAPDFDDPLPDEFWFGGDP